MGSAQELVMFLDRFVGQWEEFDVGRVPVANPLAWYAAKEARELAAKRAAVPDGAQVNSAFLTEVGAWYQGNSLLWGAPPSWPGLEQKGQQLRTAIL